ncbi:MAG: CvpA family protein [Candidatus Aphodosoma sp.]
MNFIDIIILLPMVYGLVQGVRHGIVREMAALAAVIVGIYMARYMSARLVPYIVECTGWSLSVSASVAYVIVFLAVVVCVNLMAYILSRLLKAVMLGGVNRLFGGLFGMLKWALVVSVILNIMAFACEFIPFKDNPAVQSSVLYPYLEQLLWKVLPCLNIGRFVEAVKEMDLPAMA